MLARHSRLAMPTISRWIRMNSGSNNKPPIPGGADISNADKTASDKVPGSSQSAPQTEPQSTPMEAFASFLNKTKLPVQPQPQLPNVDIDSEMSETGSPEEEPSNLNSLQQQPPFVVQESHGSADVSDSENISDSEKEQLETTLSPAQIAHINELIALCETEEELAGLLSSPDLQHLLSLQHLQDIVDTPEPIISSLPIPGKSLYPPVYHEPQWRIPVAAITFRGYNTERLALFTHFAAHVASALGIPTSKVYPLPKRRRLWTVLRSPFAHKKSQENFERITHSRGMKAWDAHPDVINLWVQMLMSHAMAGVGMRIVRWTRMELGGGGSELKKVKEQLRDLYRETNEKVADTERVRRVGEKIVELELATVEQTDVEASARVEKTTNTLQ